MKVWEFERPIIELETTIKELKNFAQEKHVNLSSEIRDLEKKLKSLKQKIYSNLTSWQKVQIARHPQRPTTLDYIERITSDFIPLCGDRLFGEDKAVVCGFAALEDKKVVLIGHQKGKDTKEQIMRNFGCAHPEGYRKAMRMMNLAQRFNMPIVCLIDTPGAYPGIGAEERGQAQAIAENIRDMFLLRTPIIVIVIGEGGSGGALGIGIGDKVFVMQYAYYSVISPEGCAAILWRDVTKAPQAAQALKLTSDNLYELGLIDGIIKEPDGGAHYNYDQAAYTLKETILSALNGLSSLDLDLLLEKRYERFRKVGIFKYAQENSETDNSGAS